MNFSQIHDFTTSLFKIVYHLSDVWNGETRFLGYPVCKPPTDLWTLQEIIFETRPTVIIETGTWCGGTALYMAVVLDCMQNYGLDGRIITIDTADPTDPTSTTFHRPNHFRVKYMEGSSTDEKIVEEVKSLIKPEDRVMVNLDSDHCKAHVLKELEIYSPLVTPGMYLIVDDTNLNGNPIRTLDKKLGVDWEGPNEALQEFLLTNDDFEIDLDREKYLLTFNPNGYLRKKDEKTKADDRDDRASIKSIQEKDTGRDTDYRAA